MRRAALLVGLTVSCTSGAAHDAGADAAAFAYQGTKCDYAVTPPVRLGLTGLALDASEAPKDPTGAAPLRVRLGLGGGTDSSAKGYADPTRSGVVTWETAAYDRNAKVRLGTSPAQLGDVRSGYVWTTPPPTIGLGTTDPPANMHEVHICGLEPGTTYTYEVGGGPAGGERWSEPQTMTTLPASGPVRIGVSGDARDSKDVWTMVQRRMATGGVAIQLFTGDLVLSGTVASLYSTWLDAIWKDPNAPGKFLTLGQQLMVMVPGNHEGSSAQFYGSFALPGSGDFGESFGSFDAGPVHVAFYDDQRLAQGVQTDGAKAILDFLTADLARAGAKRDAVPFLVLVGHRGPLSTSNHMGDSDVVKVRDAIMPIADAAKVDLVVSGHDHDYERSHPVTGPAATPTVQPAGQGTVYVVCAGAGADGYTPGGGTVAYREKNAGFGGSTGYVGTYLIVDASGTTLDVKAYGMKASASNPMGDDVLDTFTLTH